MKLQEILDTYATYAEFVQAVNEQLIALCEANPEFKYVTRIPSADVLPPACRYNGPAINQMPDGFGEPAGPDCKGCLFGQALQNLGWDDENELQYEGDVSELIETYCGTESDFVPYIWHAIQHDQDRGYKWGYILEYHRSSL